MKKNHKEGFPFFKKLSLKNSSLIFLGNFFLAVLGSCLLSTTKKDTPGHSNQINQKHFDQPSMKLTLFVSLTFPYDPIEGPKPLSLLDENKKIIVKKAFLLPRTESREQALSLENIETRYLIEVPTKSLKALIPYLGRKLWGLPYVQNEVGSKKKGIQTNREEPREITF